MDPDHRLLVYLPHTHGYGISQLTQGSGKPQFHPFRSIMSQSLILTLSELTKSDGS